MPTEFALAYADNVNQDACDELSADFQTLMQASSDVPHDVEREISEFLSELQDAASQTRQLIAEIDALTT